MPLYNAEKYLEESLQSILKQTYSEFELLCINDGATDGTLHILQTYQRIDNRIKILCNEGRFGAAYSRNKGMQQAIGEYLIFLDGDDIFEEEMLESTYKAMEYHKADLVIFEFKHVPSESIYIKEKITHGEKYIERYCKHTFSVMDCMYYEFLNWSTSPCNKLYRKEFIMSNGLEFQTLSSSNDVYFVIMALMLAKRINVLEDSRVMIYARDHFEPTRISSNRDPMCAYLAMKKVHEELIRRGVFDKLFRHFYCRLFFSLQSAIKRTKSVQSAKEFYSFLQREGIAKIRSVGHGYYEKTNDLIQNRLNDFERKSFESQWFKKESMFQTYLQENIEEIKKLFQQYELNNKTIAVWGGGIQGTAVLRICREQQLKVDAVIDVSEEKQGSQIEGFTISSPRIMKNINIIIITSGKIHDSVVEMINQQGEKMEIIDIDQYLGLI